jgi:hypothetical protein
MNEHQVKLYTLPPLPYPYILLNANNPNYRYVLRNRGRIESIIVDSGIEIFRDLEIKDYPVGHIGNLITLWRFAQRMAHEAYVTVPDYCDDYHPQSLWIGDRTNIERTVDNVVKYTSLYPDVNWLIPIQGHNRDPDSLNQSIDLLESAGITEKYGYFAVGNLCVEPDTSIIYDALKIVRERLPDKRIHAFGLKLKALEKARAYIDSMDSFAWTRHVKLHGAPSAKTTKDRIEYFRLWLNRYNFIFDQRLIADYAD